MVEVIFFPLFRKKLEKADRTLAQRVKKQIAKIVLDPDIGKPMQHTRRETREVYVSPF